MLLRAGCKPEATSWALAADRSDLRLLLLHRTLEDGNKHYKNEQIEKASELYKLGLSRFQVQLLSSGLENAAELKVYYIRYIYSHIYTLLHFCLFFSINFEVEHAFSAFFLHFCLCFA